MFKPAPGMVLVKMFEDDEAIIQKTDRGYERIAEVIQIPSDNADSFAEWHGGTRVGDIIFFDEYAYRRFTWEGVEYCIVNISEPGALWGVIKHASTEASDMSETGVSTPVSDNSDTA